jgi:hypothetical protein
MTSPVSIPCVKGEWTKVASGMQNGFLYIQELDPHLDTAFFAFNDVADGVPVLAPQVPNTTAVQIEQRELEIKFGTAKDIYIWVLSDGVSVLPSISTP